MKKQRLRFVAMVLALCLMIGDGHGMQFVRAAETEKVYPGNGYEVTITMQSAWEGGSTAEVTIKNTGNEEIRNWQLMCRFSGGAVADYWNVDVREEEGQCIFKCPETNRAIPAGESVTFGYRMENGDTDAIESVELIQKEADQKQTEDYSVSYRIVNEWDGHAVIEAEIYNNTDQDMEDWQVVFDYDADITNVWNAEILQHTGTAYTLKNKDYNAVIRANEKTGFGFEVTFPAGTAYCPSNSVIRGIGDKNKEEEAGKETEVPATMKPSIETEPEEEFDPEEDAYVYHDIENRDWNMEMINADSDIVKQELKRSQGVIRVALLDSGVNYSDEVYVSERKNFVPGQDDYSELYEDVSGHGTAVAEILASNPYGTPVEIDGYDDGDENKYTYFEEETPEEEEQPEESPDDEEDGECTLLDILDSGYEWNQGVNPKVDLISAKILDEENETTVERVVKAIDWAIEEDADIISMSFGMKESSSKLHKAIKKAEDAGILMIASAGNEKEIEYPAAYSEVMAVGAVDSMAEKAEESAQGKEIEVVAPGEFILSRGAFNSMQIFSGTSMAVPHVTGLASLLWQKDVSKSADFIRQLMNATARECGSENTSGNGLIDCEYALEKYDEFETLYESTKTELTEEELADQLENTEEIDTDEDVRKLYGSWAKDIHGGFVSSYEGTKDTKEVWNDLKKIKDILVRGVTFVDNDESGCAKMHTNPWFHGYYGKDKFQGEETDTSNYIASYQYLYRLADGMYRDGSIHFVGTNAKVFVNNKELKNAYNGINAAFADENKIGSLEWEKIHADCKKKSDGTVPKKERSLLIFGMALHTLTDTYAHSTFSRNQDKKKKIVWKAITHPSKSEKSKNKKTEDSADDTKYIKKRYKNATACANALLGKITVDAKRGVTGFEDVKEALSVYKKPKYKKPWKNAKKAIDLEELDKAYALKWAYMYIEQLGELGNDDPEIYGDVKKKLKGISLDKVKDKLKNYEVYKGKARKKEKQTKKMKYELLEADTGNKVVEIESDTGSFSVLVAKDSRLKMVETQEGGSQRLCCTFFNGEVFDEDGEMISALSEDDNEEEELDEDEDWEEMCEIYPFEYEEKRPAVYRIELSWEDKTVDLDSMFGGLFPEDEYFYLAYFVEKTYHPELADVFQKDDRAEIVKDVKDGNRPEITKLYEMEKGGYYYYLVRNFSSRSSGELSDSGATVKLYKNDAVMPIGIYEVPEGQGYFWQPFYIDGDTGTVVPVNVITNEAFGYEPEGGE